MSSRDDESPRGAVPDAASRPVVSSEVQTPTPGHRDPHGRDTKGAPAKVKGDVDEARETPTDITQRREGEPDAYAQGPAAAPANTDEEAGAQAASDEGGITPLRRR